MFGRRADGVKVKNLLVIEKAGPYFMPQRIDACNLYKQGVDCKPLDEFIARERANGVHYTYTEILIAAAVRMLHEREKTNRFINDCVIYQRKWISICMNVKPRLTDESDELTLKFYFTGRESVQDVHEILEKEITENIKNASQQATTATASILNKLPGWMFKFAMWLFRFMDKHNCLPKSLIHASPFHTSMYVTDLRSIKLDKIYHHLYNFGNTTIFAALGKVNYVPVADRSGEISVKKQMNIGFTLDERVCDGLYYGNSIRLVMKYMENPDLLKERLPEPELTGKALKKKLKQDKKLAKKNKKLAKKEAKKKK
ncbi:MAG: 2-oxo acid dehydrogenase subunit E2 [Clostridia bacterium]|nr:2-oxo acid dehydrogenase subunit E2 [Clostridia bacterium]